MRNRSVILSLIIFSMLSFPIHAQEAKKEEPTAAPQSAPEKNTTPDTDATGVLKPGPGVTRPKPIYMPFPEYSNDARLNGITGDVTLIIVIGEDGRVVDAKVLRPLGYGLDQQAIKTVKKWRFQPATFQGKQVKIQIPVVISFHMYDRQ
jgi:TonB family protein